jgi:hypothetical protein
LHQLPQQQLPSLQLFLALVLEQALHQGLERVAALVALAVFSSLQTAGLAVHYEVPLFVCACALPSFPYPQLV